MNDRQSGQTISIVVPLYNEQESVRLLYTRLSEALSRLKQAYELIFVDDGSRDQTPGILDEIYEKDSRVCIVRLRRNFGQAAALQAGFDFCQGDIIISMDGDLQHDPEDIPQFLNKMAEGYDIVSGWRVARKDPWLTRRLPSRVANWLMAKLSGIPLHDFGTTFKAYRPEIIQNIQLYGELHRFIPALASWSGATITEIPIKNAIREKGRSHYGLSRTVRVLLDLISIKFLLDYSTRPLHFFGLLSLLSLGPGTVIGFFLLYEKLFLRKEIMFEHGPLIFAAVLFFLAGIQFLSVGLIGEMLSRTYYESQKKPIYTLRETKSRRREAALRPEPKEAVPAAGRQPFERIGK
ncbi:MAG: glycosyltransferase family 2 protein [Acidobacteriia bacterium]|nr:glycosyltransferase family 2 protein [Terriglobia bacterium]